MKKTISINLAGSSFVIDDDAYERLQAYLGEIAAYFREIGDSGNEVAEDIESRMAEQLLDRLEAAKRNIVTLEDVEGIIQVVGTVSDIREESGDRPVGDAPETNEDGKASARPRRRLYRDPDEAMIAGVCAGLAAYLDIDPLWVRLVFVVSVMFGGSGIFVYLILWLVMPPAETPQQKMEMHGEDYTLAGWRERLGRYPKARRGDAGERARRGAQLFVTVIGRICQALLFVVGLAVIVGSSLMIAALVLGALALVGVGSFSYAVSPISEMVSPVLWWIGTLSVIWLAFVPVVFLMTLGASLMKLRSEFRLLPSLGLIGTWFLAALLVGLVVSDAVPVYEARLRELDDTSRYEEISLDAAVNSASVRGIRKVSVEYGEEPAVVLRGPRAGLDSLIMSEQDGELTVKADDRLKICLLCQEARQKTDLVIVTPSLSELSLRSVREAIVESGLAKSSRVAGSHVDSLSVLGESLDDINLELMDVDSVELSGSADRLDLEIDGWLDDRVSAFDFFARNAELSVLGAGTQVEVNVGDRLAVESDGLGEVVYRGEPKVTESFVDRGNSVRRKIDFGGDVIYVEEYGQGGFEAVTQEGHSVKVQVDDGVMRFVEGERVVSPAPSSIVRPDEKPESAVAEEDTE